MSTHSHILAAKKYVRFYHAKIKINRKESLKITLLGYKAQTTVHSSFPPSLQHNHKSSQFNQKEHWKSENKSSETQQNK